MNLPEVPTLGLAIQGLCPGKDTALYHSPWKSVLDGSLDGKQTPAGISHQEAVCQWPSESINILKIINQCFNTLIG